MKNLLIIIFMVFLIDHVQRTNQQDCIPSWEADLNDPTIKLCPVLTTSGEYCRFPFTFNSVEYKTCTLIGAFEDVNYFPKCITNANEWSNCLVPTDAMIDYVTTRKNGGQWVSGVSLNGGTLVWIKGQRFSENLFSFEPTPETSNEVYLTNDFSSYKCEIHPDKVTSTQITCYAPAGMPSGVYRVRVKVRGNLIPTYQYKSYDATTITVSDNNTPRITSLDPISATPGSLVTINGDFKTFCYTRDVPECSDDSGSRISRIYFSGQICNLLNPDTNELYDNITQYKVKCKLEGTEINVFNATMLVSEEFGRSLAINNMYYVTPDEKIYNFLTYPEISSISSQNGSVLGGTKLTLIGSYFYSDEYLPAQIDIGGTSCQVLSYEKNNYYNSKLTCETVPKPSSFKSNFPGNRGINVIRDNVYTVYSSLATAIPSNSASSFVLNKADFRDDQSSDVTVWIKGYFAPAKSSSYEFTIATNGVAALYMSLTENPADKTLMSYQNPNIQRGKAYLNASQYYYFELIGSIQSGGLNLTLNAKMFNTVLTDKVSSYVKNEIQDIEISSTIVQETYTLNYTSLSVSNGVQEEQEIVINSTARNQFILSFDDVQTIPINFDSTAADIQKALNDLPTLMPNLATVTLKDSQDQTVIIFNVKFSASLGDVQNIKEVSGRVETDVTELVKGVPSGDKIQLLIENKPTPLFDIRDTDANIKTSIAESFGIRCPASIITKTADVFDIIDFENECRWPDRPINDTAFCGKCARKNWNLIAYNLNSTLTYKYLCFAYKITKPFTSIIFQLFYQSNSLNPYAKVNTIADQQWHYLCVDIYAAYLSSQSTRYAQASLLMYKAYFSPYVADTYIDAVSLRKTLPYGYDINDNSIIQNRRLYPSLQIFQTTHSVYKSNNIVTWSYRPNNCSYNLINVTVRQKFTNPLNNIIVTHTRYATPPVTGTFDLEWNGELISNLSASITENSLKNYLETIKNFGTTVVTRSKDCAGFKWSIKWDNGGDKPLFTLAKNNLTGNSVSFKITNNQEGGVLFSPILDDMLRTYNTKPQIVVTINNIPSKCTTGCTFEWLDESTPAVTSIDTSNPNSIILTGTGFDTVTTNNIVFIGETTCNVTSSSQTQITCKPAEGPVGVYNITLNVLNKGLARMNTHATYEFKLIASSISPSICGTGGGLKVNITGSGFTGNTKIKIDGNECKLLYNTYSLVTCQVPSNPTNVNKTVDVFLEENSYNSSLLQKFSYDSDHTPVISSISSTKLSVLGGERVTLTGTNLPQPLDNVYIGGKNTKIIFSTSTEIVISTPQMNPGLYELIVPSGTLGYSRVDTLLEYVFYVSSVSTKVSSIRGGTIVSINGDGFSTDCSLNQVSFERFGCDIINCTKDSIVCKTKSANTVYYVDNTGHNPKFGDGYAWSKPYLNINFGDYVSWSWKSPNAVPGLNFKVEQLRDAFLEEAEGFTSGIPTPKGSYIYQFNKPGTYYYWSGYIDVTRVISFRGVIVVSNEQIDKDLEVNVALNDINSQKCVFPFEYKSVMYNSCTGVDKSFNWCSPTPIFSGQYLPCDPANVIQQNNCSSQTYDLQTCNVTSTNNYTLRFTHCQVAQITSISPLIFNYDTVITIDGSGFSSDSCENEVLINGLSCLILASSTTNIQCKINKNSGLIPNNLYGIEVLVKNKGYALQNDFYQLKFQATISSITPTQGSITGGSLVKIDGDGFTDSIQVYIGSNLYDKNNIKNLSYDSISFITQPEEGLFNVTVGVNGLEAYYESIISFESQIIYSPDVQSISPLTVNESTIMTLNGNNFVNDVNEYNIRIGSEICHVLTANTNSLTCQLDGLNLGEKSIQFNIKSLGNTLVNSLTVTGLPSLISLTPSSGSTNGGSRIVLSGNGFDSTTRVKLDQAICEIVDVKINEIICITSEHVAQSNVLLTVMNGNRTYDNLNQISFNYDSSLTPLINSLSPTSELSLNSLLTITGTGFSTDINEVHVLIGDSVCNVQSSTLTQITCILGLNSAGTYPFKLQIDSKGYANKNFQFTYNLTISNTSHVSSGVAGGLVLKIQGSGYSKLSNVTICNNECKLINQTYSEIYCIVPRANNTNTDSSCNLIIKENNLNAQTSFNYLKSITPTITSLSPLRGGTGGGTLVTIIGTNFPTDSSIVKVTIADSECTITTITSTSIQCRTGSFEFSSIKALAKVYIKNVGDALNDNAYFEYIDLWSSRFTWGGNPPPGEGEIVEISRSQTVYFDANTPVLKGIIIIGGALIFDDQQDVHLQTEYIIITGGGKLQIGTEDKPFLHKAEITMYGTARSIELPIFGSKVIALRNGTIDMHGKPVGVTWTRLDQTAQEGTDQITLQDSVIWDLNSDIVISTTGDKYSVRESEVRKIIAKSADNRTLTLDSKLNFTHLGVSITVGTGANTHIIEKRAEVGLLTRNILYRGKNDDSWNSLKTAKACPIGFNPSEFAVQTCFLGRYGDEIGSDEFGATIMIHSDMSMPRDREYVIARIQNVELFHVGQSYRLGRYPIHFHLNGDMRSSYVKECAIHESFNRAVNIHGTNYVTVERNFIYNIMGGAYFLEDGVEIGNAFRYNLAIFVKSSSSLLNEDSTPAAYWVTNPNNTLEHNAVGGDTHFGYWYRILDRPDGPSFNPNYCPKKIPFGKFFNNSVHSSGRIGIWIFPGYTPSQSGSCWDGRPSVAKFDRFISYGLDKGAEWVFSNNLQFNNFVVFDHTSVGIETKNVVINNGYSVDLKSYIPTFYNEQTGPAVLNSLIVGNSDSSSTKALYHSGLVLAWDRGQLIKNVTFINFPDENSHAMRGPEIIGTCVIFCGGWVNRLADLKFENVRYRGILRWDWDLVYQDLDGSLTGSLNNVVVYNDNLTIADSRCQPSSNFINGTVCSNTKGWIRVAFNHLVPDLVLLTNFTNSNKQRATIPKLAKRLTHKNGFMSVMEANQEYLFEFDEALYPTNVSYSAGVYNIEPNNWIIIKHRLWKKPDRVYFGSDLKKESLYPLNSTSESTTWYWDNSTMTLSYILSNKAGVQPFIDYQVEFNAYKCRYAGCSPPVSPAFKLPVTARPPDALFWSNIETWSFSEPGWGGYQAKAFTFPSDYQSVKIPDGKYVVVDCPIPKLKYLQIEGVLEFDNGLNHTIDAELIFINGGQLIIGWEKNPMLNNVNIILRGGKNDLNFYLPDGISTIGGKGIGVFGGLDLHGRPRYPSWTQLANSSYEGSNVIQLKAAVDWQIGELIVISPTSYKPTETEVFKIIDKSSDNRTLTLNATLKYDHMGFSETYPSGESYEIGAGVGLLSRNIKIIAEEYPEQLSDLYGSRTIVSDYSTDGPDGPLYYKGYARLTDVEFVHPGQYSRNSGDDYKYGILFSNLGDYNYSRPSYVRNCAFRNGFSAAIGILNSNSIPIEDNVIHHTIDYAIFLGPSHSTQIRRNFMVLIYWASSFITWEADFNTEYWGAVDAHLADTFVLEYNLITGSERLGLYYKGDVCDGESLGIGKNHSFKNNQIYSCMAGVVILPIYFYENLTCIKISNFLVYKSMHWGIYYQSVPSILVESNKLIDNHVNVFTLVIQPATIEHIFSGKTYRIRNSLIVGQSSQFDCIKDVRPNDLNFLSAKKIDSFGAGFNSKGKVGLVWANFLGAQNGAPLKPWPGQMTFCSLDGVMFANNLTIANFDETCAYRNYVITPNIKNDDGQHPVIMSDIKLHNVNNRSKVWIFRPNIAKINIWDCIDMDCDGLKKNLLNDIDGSFLGSPGTVISQSEFEWGSQQRGLGDYRIPKEALAAANGSMIPPKQVYDLPGIVRSETDCIYRSDWQAYECHNLEHRMLIIESMDPDSLTRRLSPVAIFSDNKTGKKYLDLINGPQDHGCCFGYTCLKRISTFMTIVAANQNFDIYLSSTAPKQLRFRILNADSSFKIRLSMHYFTSNRIDVYKNETFIEPTNAYTLNGKMMLSDTSQNLNNYMPHYLNASGTNLAVRTLSKVYFTIHGSDFIDLKVTPTVFVKFGVPAITEDSFFDEATLTRNFADLLGIDPSKIRKVEIISETAVKRRKRQSTQLKYVALTIFENPIRDLNDQAAIENINSTLKNLTATIINKYTTGELQADAEKKLNVTLMGLLVQKPNSNGTDAEITKINKLTVIREASGCKELSPCDVQPILAVLDEDDKPLLNMDSDDFPWIVKAILYDSSNPRQELIYQTEASLDVNGYVKFTSLGVSEIATSFKIKYEFKTPNGVNSTTFNPLTLQTNTLLSSVKASFSCKSNEDDLIVTQNELFNISISVIDSSTLNSVKNLSWKNHEWQASLQMYQLDKCQSSGLLKTELKNASVDLELGIFYFSNLYITSSGMYQLLINIKTMNNDDYNFECLSKSILVKKLNQVIKIDNDQFPSIFFKFQGDFNQYKSNVEVFKSIFYNCILDRFNFTISRTLAVYSGSIMVNFDGTASASAMTEMQNYIKSGQFSLAQGVELISADISGLIIEPRIESVTTQSSQETSSTFYNNNNNNNNNNFNIFKSNSNEFKQNYFITFSFILFSILAFLFN